MLPSLAPFQKGGEARYDADMTLSCVVVMGLAPSAERCTDRVGCLLDGLYDLRLAAPEEHTHHGRH